MDKQFWIDKWLNNNIGFHQAEINPSLQKYWSRLQIKPSEKVFFPLCGKSKDMHWVALKGHAVVGVELSELAIKDFFFEANLQAHKDGDCFESGLYKIYCQDFFSMTSKQLQDVGAVFDRASMIALPPEMREDYVKHMINILPRKTEMLLITIDYDSDKLGPPFAVKETEVRDLYQDHFTIDKLEEKTSPSPGPLFQQEGVYEVTHRVFYLRPI